jgi:hypothetical protein
MLTMRPTGLGAGIDKDRPDYAVFCEPSSSERREAEGGSFRR